MLQQYLSVNESILLSDEALSNLNEVQQVFLRLAWFFENPDKANFNLGGIYQNLQDDWLEFSLEVICDFFRKDTYLIQDPTHSIITEGDYYMNQSRFAEFLNDNGLKYDRSKLNVYINRGKAPKADITVSGIKYWERSTCEKFLNEQLKERKYKTNN